MITVELPPAAREKLLALRVARGAAEDASRAAHTRLQTAPRDVDERMRAALAAETSKHQHQFGQLSRVLGAVQQWISQLPANVALEASKPAVVELKQGQMLNDAIAEVRSEVRGLRDHLTTVKAASLPATDMKQLCAAWVHELADVGRPTVAIQQDRLRVMPRDTDMLSPASVMRLVLGLQAWANPAALLAALHAEIDELPGHADAMPANARRRAVAELEEQLLALERTESALIERAANEGLDVPHRFDVDPRAYLGVAIVQAQAQQVA